MNGSVLEGLRGRGKRREGGEGVEVHSFIGQAVKVHAELPVTFLLKGFICSLYGQKMTLLISVICYSSLADMNSCCCSRKHTVAH